MNITIIDDQISESLEEIFLVDINSIDSNNLGAVIETTRPTIITIVDDDLQTVL